MIFYLHFRMNKTMLYRKLYDPGDLENKVEVTEVEFIFNDVSVSVWSKSGH